MTSEASAQSHTGPNAVSTCLLDVPSSTHSYLKIWVVCYRNRWIIYHGQDQVRVAVSHERLMPRRLDHAIKRHREMK